MMQWLAWIAFAVRAPRANGAEVVGAVANFALPGGAAGAEQSLFASGPSRYFQGRYVRVVCDVDAHICFFPNAEEDEADADDWPLAAGVPQDFYVIPGSSGYFSVFSAEAGTCWYYIG